MLRLLLGILLSSTDSRSMGRTDPALPMSSLPLCQLSSGCCSILLERRGWCWTPPSDETSAVWSCRHRDLSLLRKNKQLWPFFDNAFIVLVGTCNGPQCQPLHTGSVFWNPQPSPLSFWRWAAGSSASTTPQTYPKPDVWGVEGKQEGDGVQLPHNAASLGGSCWSQWVSLTSTYMPSSFIMRLRLRLKKWGKRGTSPLSALWGSKIRFKLSDTKSKDCYDRGILSVALKEKKVGYICGSSLQLTYL